MNYRSFNRLITVLYLSVMTIWSGMRYYRSGHLVYHAESDAWWVQAGVPMAHVSTGAASNLATLGKNLLVVWAQCRRSIALCTAVYVAVMVTAYVREKAKENRNGISGISCPHD
jgi:hypothetical protein